MNIALLLTCFNRKNSTLNCLKSLFLYCPEADVYLVDDGSTDGTANAVSSLYPSVNIIQGSGNLFWNRGMYKAWDYASTKGDYEFYIWLNDDVVLYSYCISELLECSYLSNHSSIISGIVESSTGNRILYGGSDASKILIKPNGLMQSIVYLNGNIVLFPKSVFRRVGNLDPFFHHDLGDVDYGLRARDMGIDVLSTRRSVASGIANNISRLRINNSNLFYRFKHLYSPLGSNPNINFYFRYRHFGLFHAIIFYLFQHFLIIIPDSLNSFLFKNKYK